MKHLLAYLAVMTICVACQKPGPLERSGERADEIVDNVKEGKPALHKKGALEKAGEAVDEAVDDAKDKVRDDD